MTCTTCGAENRAGAKFCSECGSGLALGCPSCGAAVTLNARFCSECGEPLGGATRPAAGGLVPTVVSGDGVAAAMGSGAERRLVTVMFADLVGYTTLSEGRDPETMRELLSRYFETASEIVGRYGGTVEKFIGDAVMAVWGTPVAHEDDAERAVRAALDLVAAVPQLAEQLGELAARAGVLTGEAAVTKGATNQGMVAGDLVNTASRLQSVAPPGAVLVGDATRAASEGAIAFESAGESVLKGKAAPVAAHRALRVVAKVRGVGRSDGLEPPFVGREAEFRLVRDAFHAVGRERRARLVSITGEAGIGKSRLAWEYSKYTDGLATGIFWHEGRSPAYGEGVSFWALSEMVRKRAGLLEQDDVTTTIDRIASTLAMYVPSPADRDFIEPCLLALLGVGEPPSGGRDRLFAGWRAFFEALAAADPVVLVFEDIQWADDGLLDFIERLLEWSQSYPIFVLTLSRPELLDRRPTWGAGRNAAALALAPLGDDSMRQLLEGLVPRLPAAAARIILGRAGGMPLYAVETVRMLIGSGHLEAAGDGTFRVIGELDAIDVPPSLQALIAARLDALSPADRSLLQDAAVLGQTFAVPALVALTGESTGVLEPRLRALVTRDLLALDTDPRSPERGQFGFVQALIREVAYGTLGMRDRRSRHLAAARYFEALGDEELSGPLATHYHAAYQAAADGPEATALAAQARIALRAAAERAASLGSPEQALAFYDAAAALPGDVTERLTLLSRAGEIAAQSGRHARARDLTSEAATGWERLGNREQAGLAYAQAVDALVNIDMAEARRAAEAGIATFADLGSESMPILSLRYAMARILARHSDPIAAHRILSEIMTGVEGTRDIRFILRVLSQAASNLAAVGRPIEGMIILEGVLARAEAAGYEDIADRARINLSVAVADDDVLRGHRLSIEGLERSMRRGTRGSAAYYAGNAAEYGLHVGDISTSEASLRAIVDLGVEGMDRLLALGQLATITALLGTTDIDAVETVRREAPSGHMLKLDMEASLAMVSPDGRAAAEAALQLGRIDELNAPFAYLRATVGAARTRDVATMRMVREEGAAIARTGAWVEAIKAGIDAIAEALMGDRDRAVRAAADVWTTLDALNVRFDAALVDLGMAAALGTGDPEGAAAADRARRMFAGAGMRQLVAIVDGLTPSGDPAGGTPRGGTRVTSEVAARQP